MLSPRPDRLQGRWPLVETVVETVAVEGRGTKRVDLSHPDGRHRLPVVEGLGLGEGGQRGDADDALRFRGKSAPARSIHSRILSRW